MCSVPTLLPTLQANLQRVHERITKAARAAGRDPSSVRLVAVSKSFGPDVILNAASAGQRAFAENYVQEAAVKMTAVTAMRPDLAFEWHFIGPLQSNKTAAIAAHFDWVQSVDRLKLAERLSAQRSPEAAPLNVLLQVNISAEASKSGLAPDETPGVAQAVRRLPRLRLRGLMAIPEPQTDPAQQHTPFKAMKQLFDALSADGIAVDTLSIGMSDDFEAAIAEGSTMVRIGTAIFGARERRR
jgi:pyridoxal phosphate enzyme (YggS family)